MHQAPYTKDKPYYLVDASQLTGTLPCGSDGMIMRGIEVDNSISIYAAPDYIHTKWNIAHEKPLFDYEQGSNCTVDCTTANPCGKANDLYELWKEDVMWQLRGNKPHMILTMCQKGGKWADSSMKDPLNFNPKDDNYGYAWVSQFAPLDYGNTIDEHVEWDKAPKDSNLGDGEGWEPFKFSQCCTTLVIAPQI